MLRRRAATRDDETLRLGWGVLCRYVARPNLVPGLTRCPERIPGRECDTATETAGLSAPPNRPPIPVIGRNVGAGVSSLSPNKPAIRRVIKLLPEPLVVRIFPRRILVHRHVKRGVLAVPPVVDDSECPPQSLIRKRHISLTRIHLNRGDTRPN